MCVHLFKSFYDFRSFTVSSHLIVIGMVFAASTFLASRFKRLQKIKGRGKFFFFLGFTSFLLENVSVESGDITVKVNGGVANYSCSVRSIL